MENFGGVKQSLAWHAAAQNAKTAHLIAAFDHDGFEAVRAAA
jgi:hypothetical protein